MAAARRSCAAAGRSAAEGRPGEGTAGAGACGAPRCSHGAEGVEWGAGSTPRARGVGRARRAARLERDPFRLQARVSFFVGSCCLPQPRGVDAWLRAARSAPGRALECVLPAVCRCWARGRASWRHAWHTLRTGGRRPAGCRGALPLWHAALRRCASVPPPSAGGMWACRSAGGLRGWSCDASRCERSGPRVATRRLWRRCWAARRTCCSKRAAGGRNVANWVAGSCMIKTSSPQCPTGRPGGGEPDRCSRQK